MIPDDHYLVFIKNGKVDGWSFGDESCRTWAQGVKRGNPQRSDYVTLAEGSGPDFNAKFWFKLVGGPLVQEW